MREFELTPSMNPTILPKLKLGVEVSPDEAICLRDRVKLTVTPTGEVNPETSVLETSVAAVKPRKESTYLELQPIEYFKESPKESRNETQ